MQGFEVEAFIFVLLFVVMMSVACIGIGWIGYGLITKLGKFPSKTPVIQMGVLFPLIVIEVVSFTLFLVFLKVLEPVGH